MKQLTILSLYLHKDLGMSIRLTVSPHFYSQAAQWPCNNAISMLTNTELLDRSYAESWWRTEFEADIYSIISVPPYISQLGDDKKTRNDYKIAKHYLDLQERATKPYVFRRHNLYLVAVVHNDKRPNTNYGVWERTVL